jgi:23S rRNA pseudouridine1911/1915/1917 synthase
VIDAPIGRAARHRTQMAVRAAGRPARTRYEVRATDADRRVALLECELDTGRTHQIRVHLAAIGHPVVGDPVYGPGGGVAAPRPFLHAYSLAFAHPRTGDPVAVEAALPDDLGAVLAERGVAPPEVEDRPARAGGVEAAG